ncbi:hypothetical protein HMPREF9098_1615 [Kingella denitrificans ATCC 33394]|uniref:Uncharacterized protein n=1 Tax=Kingella denitrificans ATCC 33394 TaxID=888741 RepID=F0F0I0_9NEIS|nr:hypothetical protein HMPREF9098_1615 [Kingella denitrificans ATCC 33394]
MAKQRRDYSKICYAITPCRLLLAKCSAPLLAFHIIHVESNIISTKF